MCNKKCYQSSALAIFAGQIMLKKKSIDTDYFRSYYCHQHKAWHLTSQEKDKKDDNSNGSI